MRLTTIAVAAATMIGAVGPVSAQGIMRGIEDGPSMNSMDMLIGRAGVPRLNLTTRIQAIDPAARTLTVENGDVFTFANDLNPSPELKPGQSVVLQYEVDGDRKILQGIMPL